MIEKTNCKNTGTLVDAKAEGALFRVSVSNSLRSTTDWKAVALSLAKKAAISDNAFDNIVAANTHLTETW